MYKSGLRVYSNVDTEVNCTMYNKL